MSKQKTPEQYLKDVYGLNPSDLDLNPGQLSGSIDTKPNTIKK